MMLEATRKLLHFNSIKVRLERSLMSSGLSLTAHFNSIKVRLEHPYFSAHALETYYFNSIKVRLEPVKSWA